MKIISVHAPKAGGSSVRATLAAAFGAAFLADNHEDPADPTSPRNVDPERYFARRRALPSGVECIHGHFHPGQFDTTGAFLFTQLRHPVDNIMSIYFFWKDHPPHGQPLHDYFLRENLDIFQTAQLPLLRYLYSHAYFGSFDMGRFDLIGRHEDRETTLARLSDATGIPFNPAIHENPTPPSRKREEVAADPAVIARLRDILAADIDFYEKVAG